MLTPPEKNIANAINALPIGGSNLINGHKVTRLERETETYLVDDQEVAGFVQTWITVRPQEDEG